MADQFVFRYVLELQDRASAATAKAQAQIRGQVAQTGRVMQAQAASAQAASGKVASATARQSAEWKQVARAAGRAEREVAQSAVAQSSAVDRSTARQVQAMRRQGASYSEIVRQQKAAGASARETAAAIEQSAAREQKAMTASSGAARKHSGVLGGLRSQLKGFGGMAAGLGATFAAFKGLDFLRESVNDVETLARATIKLQKITGQDATTASSWIQVAKQRGLSAQQLSRAFVTLEKNQVKGAAGAKTQAEAFRALGISQEQLRRSDPQQLILAVADGMKNLENPSKRAAAAQALFGRAGVSLIATLSGGSQAIRDQLEVVQKYGASLDKNGVKNAMKLVAEQRKLSLAMDGVKLSIGQALVPLLARGAGALAKFVLQMRQGTGAGGQVRRVFEQMADGAKSVWSAIGPAVKALAAFARQHPGVVKVAGGVVAIGVGLRALRFASAITGATQLLGVLTRLGKVSVGGGIGRAAVPAGRLATYAAMTSRIGALVIASLAARKGLTDLTAQANKSHSGVARVLGKVGEFVHTVGWKPIEAAAGRLKRTFDQLSGITPKLAATSQRTTERLQQILGRSQGRNLAATFAREAASAGTATHGMVTRIVAQLGRLKGDARVEARKAMSAMVAQMVASGQLTKAAAAKLEKGIVAGFGPLKDDLGGAARRGIRAITREFGALPGGITNPLRLSLAQVRTYMGRILDVTNATVSQLRTMRALLAAGIEPVSPRSIGGGHRPATGRRGGILDGAGFRRYQAGGMVPALVSPGEMIVHGDRAGMVPGAPVAADNVAMMLPVGAAVITGHGQQLLAHGATVREAIARQIPHFQGGGMVHRGRASWYGGPHDQMDSGPTAYGFTTGHPGISLNEALHNPGLGRKFYRVVSPNKHVAVLPVIDKGPADWTHRGIDITYSALGMFGYRESNFPTDSIWRWEGPYATRASVRGGVSAGAATAGRISGLAQAQARHVSASRTRAGLVSDAYQQGLAQGQAGLTRRALASEGNAVYRSIAGAYRLPAAKTIPSPRPARAAGAGGGSPRDPGYYNRVKGLTGLGSYDGYRVANWIVPALRYSRAHGGRFHVTSGYRSHATNVAHGRNYHSLHEDTVWPGGAVDFGGQHDAAGYAARASFLRGLRGYRGPKPKPLYGDDGHVSGTGHRRGGIIGGFRRFQGGGGPVQVGPVRHQETTGTGIPAYGAHLQAALRRSLTFRSGTFAQLNRVIEDAADRKLAALRAGLARAVKRGGTEAQVKRLQGALSLVDAELGRRSGLLERRIAQRTTRSDTRLARTDTALRLAGTDPESIAGLTSRLAAERGRGDALHRTRRDLDKELRRATLARDRAEIDRIKSAIEDNITATQDSRASQRELGRAREQARLSARTAFVQGLTDIAASRTSLAQTGLQGIELQQRLAGTYDTGGQQRADYIRQAIIPDLQAEQAGIRAQGIEAMRQNNADLARQLTQAYAEKQNEILQAQLDAQEATAKNTEDTADAIKNLGGTLGFEFGGARLTDALVQSGIGA